MCGEVPPTGSLVDSIFNIQIAAKKGLKCGGIRGHRNSGRGFTLADQSEGSVVGTKRCEPPGGCLLLELDAAGYCVDTPEALP